MYIFWNPATSGGAYYIKASFMHNIFYIKFNTDNWRNLRVKPTIDNKVKNMTLYQARQLSLLTSISANCVLTEMQKLTVHGRTSVTSIGKQINRCIVPSLHQPLSTSGLYTKTNIYGRSLMMTLSAL